MKLYDAIIKEREKKGKKLNAVVEHEPVRHDSPQTHPPRRHRFRTLFGIAIAVLAAGGFFFLGILYSRATVTITPRKVAVTLDDSLITVPHEQVAPNEPLHFQAMVLKGDVSREIIGDKLVESYVKASGRVAFFNEYSSKPLVIKKGTTIQAATGKRYVTAADITIPGFKTEAGTRIAGTSNPVQVTAAAVGSDYNVEGTTFTVVGYTGDRKTKVYARSSGSITGGESGMVHTVTEDNKEQIIDVLQQLLTEKLKRQARAQIPKGFISFPDLQFVVFDTASVNLKNPSIKFPVTLSGTLVLYLFPEEPLATAVAGEALQNNPGIEKGGTYRIPDFAALVVEPVSLLPLETATIPQELTIKISGTGTLVGSVDEEKVKAAVVGKPFRSFDEAMKAFPSVLEAMYRKIPFWTPYFPSKTESIKIIVR